MIAIYKRVSTDKQETDSQSFVIEAWLLKNKPGQAVIEFTDKGYTGKNTNRPAFQEMIRAIQRGEITAVVVFRLDRVGRNALASVREVAGWIEQGLEFFAVDQPYLQLGKDNPLRMSMLGIFSDQAQMEREAIAARVKSGLAVARANGVKLGPPTTVNSEEVLRLRAGGYSFRQIASKLGIGVGSAHRVCKGR
jgi:site-specific DNA recombinase